MNALLLLSTITSHISG